MGMKGKSNSKKSTKGSTQHNQNLNEPPTRGWYSNSYIQSVDKFNAQVDQHRQDKENKLHHSKNQFSDRNAKDSIDSKHSNQLTHSNQLNHSKCRLNDPSHHSEDHDSYMNHEDVKPLVKKFELDLETLKRNFRKSTIHVFQHHEYKHRASEEIPPLTTQNTIHAPFEFSIDPSMRQKLRLPVYNFYFVPYNTCDEDLTIILNEFRKYNVIGMQIVTRKEHPGFIALYEPLGKLAYVFEIAIIRNRFVVPYTYVSRRMYIFESSRRENLYLNPLLKMYLEEPGKIFIGWNLNREIVNLNRFRNVSPYAIWSPHFLEKSFPERESEYQHVCADRHIILTLFYAYRKFGPIPSFWRGFADLWLSFCAAEYIRRSWNIFHQSIDSLYEFLLLTAIRGDGSNLQSLPESYNLRLRLLDVPIDTLSYPRGMKLHEASLSEILKSWPVPTPLSIQDKRARLLSRPTTIYKPVTFEILQEKNRGLKKVLESKGRFSQFIELHNSWLSYLYNSSGERSNKAPVLGMKRSRESAGILLGLNEKRKGKWMSLYSEPELSLPLPHKSNYRDTYKNKGNAGGKSTGNDKKHSSSRKVTEYQSTSNKSNFKSNSRKQNPII